MSDAARPAPERDFEPHRRRPRGLAYRMLGSVSDAEDVVQDAYLRWHAADRERVADSGAFLTRVVARLCLDRLKSFRRRRETYIGPWLPEPVLDASAWTPDDAGEIAADLSVALMLALERLSPLERAAFLLHDIFDLRFVEIAVVLERSEVACRQLSARAREHVRASRPRVPTDPDAAARLVAAFMDAARTGDATALARLLAEDVAMHSDGGGRRRAARNVVRGRERVARFFAGIARKPAVQGIVSVEPARVNALPGFVVRGADDTMQTIAFEVREGAISGIYMVLNPAKLGHLRRLTRSPPPPPPPPVP
ncbi:MAG: sigma-70 family RNA polymerase sigma factor [Acetobacteraceae bacterium]|nr:sigma-70 family RNA polymerase sigma factor [Acetobacteraceae bacterium]